MKKILSTILAIILLVSSLPIVFAETAKEADNKAVSEAAALVEYLEVMNVSEKADMQIMRADFATYLARILNINEYSTTNKVYFNDIPKGHWAEVVVNNLVQLGIITVGDTREFRPDDYITLEEATKMVLGAIGYMPVADAMDGNIMDNYMKIADKIDLFENVNRKEAFTRKNAAVLLANAMTADMYEGIPKNGVLTFQQVEGKNLLAVYKNIYIVEGQVKAIGQTAIYPGEEIDEGWITIGTQGFKYDGNAELIGCEVKAYYKVEDDKDDEVVLIFSDMSEKDIIEIPGTLFEGFAADYTLKYYESEEDNTINKISIPTNAAFIYNNMAIDQDIVNSVNINDDGSIRIIRSKSTREYDIVVVRQARVVVASHVDQVNRIVYDSYDTQPAGYFSEDLGVVKIYDASGNKTNFNSIGRGSVISIYKAKGDYIEARISDSSVYGVFEKEFEKDGKKYFVLDGVEYQVRDLYYPVIQINTVKGKTAAFKLDEFGIICQMTTTPTAETDGYYIGYYVDLQLIQTDEDKVYMEVYSNHAQMERYKLAEKVMVDGQRYKEADKAYAAITNSLTEATAVLQAQPMWKIGEKSRILRFKLNELNEISAIDTPYRSDKETEYTLQMHAAETYVCSVYPYTGGYNVLYDTATTFFTVPMESKVATSGIGDFAIQSNLTGYPAPGMQDVVAYKWNKDNAMADVILVYGTVTTTMDFLNNHFMFEKYETVLNVDDEPVDYAIGWFKGQRLRLAMDPDMVNADGLQVNMRNADIEKGDIVMYALNANQEIKQYSVVYDYSQDKVNKVNGAEICTSNVASTYGSTSFAGVYLGQNRITHAYPLRVIGDTIIMSYQQNGPMHESFVSTGVPVVVYDSNLSKNNIRVGSVGDVIVSSHAGADCSTIVAVAQSTYWRSWYIYN